MKVCRVCGRVFDRGRWRRERKGEVARAELMGKKVEYVVCEDCSRAPESHEAVLQPRGRFERGKIEEIIRRELRKSERRGEVEDVFEKGGDYYFTSKKIARAVAKKLEEMGAEIKETSKFRKYDRERSIPLTILTIAAHFRIRPGDVVERDGRLYLVEKVRGKWVWTDGGKMRVGEVRRVEAQKFRGIVVSRRPPAVFIPETNETVEVEEIPECEKVEVVRARGKVWVRKLIKEEEH